MRTLSIIEFLTLDGVMQGLGGPDEDREGGFDYGGWGAPYGDEALGRRAGEGMRSTTAYLFGRKTYEKMAAHWPNVGDDDPIAAHLNRTPKYVVTRTITELEWADSHVLSGEVDVEVEALKATGEGTIAVLGSGELAQTLFAEGLVDEYSLFIHPLVLGIGKRLFRETPAPIPLELVSCTPTTTGVLLVTYRPAAGAATGS